MTVKIATLQPAAAICAAALLYGASIAARAQDAAPWSGDQRAAGRLIAGSPPAHGAAYLRAGIEIRLAPGWHTYWRYPGDAGVPPVFDFAGSRNLREINVLWPAPQRIDEAGSATIGYVGHVIFPLRIVPKDWREPVMLQLKLVYAACNKLCMPAEGRSALVLPVGRSAQDEALLAAEARVPKASRIGAGAALAIKSVRRERGDAHPRIVVDVAAPRGVPVDLFAEGPTAEWALPVPVLSAGAPAGLHRFVFDLDGAPPGADYKNMQMRLTAVTPSKAIEATARLD